MLLELLHIGVIVVLFVDFGDSTDEIVDIQLVLCYLDYPSVVGSLQLFLCKHDLGWCVGYRSLERTLRYVPVCRLSSPTGVIDVVPTADLNVPTPAEDQL